MRMKNMILIASAFVSAFCLTPSALAFEGRINAAMTSGNQSEVLLYTVGTNFLRVEMTATNWPNSVNILDRNSGELTLLFPNNRSFVRLKPVTEDSSMSPGFPRMPGGLPPGVGPQSQSHPPGAPAMPNLPPSPGIGSTNLPGMPAPPPMPAVANMPPGVGPQSVPGAPTMPAMPEASGGMPAMPMMPMPMEKLDLKATGEKTNLLGFACEKFEIKQRGETMEIWATDQLLPFQNYVRNQPPRFGPRMIEEQWAGLLTVKKLFPLHASLRFDNGAERFRFEVKSVMPQKLTGEEAKLFDPPPGYFEIQPLPF
jgi:hypothetical protein